MAQALTMDAAAEEQFREPPDYDSWYSALASGVFHFLIVLFAAFITTALAPRDRLPPAVAVVQVAEVDSTGGESAEDPAGEALQMSEERPDPAPTAEAETTQETITDVKPIDVPDVTLSPADSQKNIQEQVAIARNAAASARAAAAKTLNENLGGAPSGGGGGTGTGRAGRAARWILRFNNSSPSAYLSQLGGLGAEIAFPQRGDKYLYFTNLGGNPSSVTRDLSGEKRIYWMDNDPQSFGPVANHLGVKSPPMLIAFLPIELEEKILKLEKAHQGIEDEDQILQTIFECVSGGGGYDVRVVDQTLRGQ